MKADVQTTTVGLLRSHLEPFADNWDLFFGNGNLHFYRTKQRGAHLVQIEFNEDTDLLSEQSWIPIEQGRPDAPDTVAVICRQTGNGLLRLTGFYDQGTWTVIGNRPELNLVEVTHWSFLPDEIPPFAHGDPL